MLGRDIGKGIIQLSTKLAPDDNIPIVKFSRLLTDWLDKETALAYANDKPEKVDRITDKAECLRATIEGTQPSTAGDLRSMLERLFSRENSQIVLSSGHRSKGLEWPLVVHLDPWRIPSKQAKIAASLGNNVPMEQEENLQYVTETRTKHTLVNASLETFNA
jgi:superfamily I DNA/RNA helicase